MTAVEAASRGFSAEGGVQFPPRKLWIGDEWVEPDGGRSFVTENPATEEPLCEVAAASPGDVDRAVKAARAALHGDWGWTPARERDPLDPRTRLGALVSRKQREGVLGYVEGGEREGARIVCGGEPADLNGRAGSCSRRFSTPTPRSRRST